MTPKTQDRVNPIGKIKRRNLANLLRGGISGDRVQPSRHIIDLYPKVANGLHIIGVYRKVVPIERNFCAAEPGFVPQITFNTLDVATVLGIGFPDFRGGVVKNANAAYRNALGAAGYTILRSEVDAADSEVVFRNDSTTGQVSITQECKSRVRLRITSRPA